MRVLGIETSCDETAVALYDDQKGLMAHVLHSQVDLHAKYGGIVPELASRDHIAKLIPLIETALQQAKITLNTIDAIAYTAGPGLVGALLVGASCAKALGYSLGIKTIAIHHMEGHLLAALLEEQKPEIPFLALLVSGGHTLLIEVQAIGKYKILGETLDDAAGEAFDKVAKLLGLGYPGGPKLAQLAQQGTPSRFLFPRPMTDRPGLDFSFSGLKTFALNTLQSSDRSAQSHADIAYAFQEAIVDTLFIKCTRALKQTGLRQLVIAGGVGANQRLREKFKSLEKKGYKTFYPRLEFCTDNGAMIAFAGLMRLSMGVDETLAITVRSRWDMENL